MLNMSQTQGKLVHLLYICLPLLARVHPLQRKNAQVNLVVFSSSVGTLYDVIRSNNLANLLATQRQVPQSSNAHGTRRGRDCRSSRSL